MGGNEEINSKGKEIKLINWEEEIDEIPRRILISPEPELRNFSWKFFSISEYLLLKVQWNNFQRFANKLAIQQEYQWNNDCVPVSTQHDSIRIIFSCLSI